MSAAVMHDVAHLEVGLRNCYDRALSRATPPGSGHWTAQPSLHFGRLPRRSANGAIYDVNDPPRRQIARAVKAAGGHGAPPGKVVAELGFGFWRYLSTAAHAASLWVPHLHTAFVAGTSRVQVDRPVSNLNLLRNRVAHHEPVLRVDLPRAADDLLVVSGLISPELRSFIADRSTWHDVYATKPC